MGPSFSGVVILAVTDPSVLPRSCCGVVRGSLLRGVQPTQLYSSVAYGLELHRWHLVVLPPCSTRSEATIIVEYCDLKTAAGFLIQSVASNSTGHRTRGHNTCLFLRTRNKGALRRVMLCRMVPTYDQKLGPSLLVQHTLLSLLRPEISSLMLLICLPLPELLQPQSLTELASYVDAAHATDLVMCRLISGLVIMFCDGPMAFNRFKIQSTASPSSTKAEFLAAIHAAEIANYLWSILFELGYPKLGPIMSSFSRLPDGVSQFHVPPLPCSSLDGSLQRSLNPSGFLKCSSLSWMHFCCSLQASAHNGGVCQCISHYCHCATVYCIHSSLLRSRLTPQSCMGATVWYLLP